MSLLKTLDNIVEFTERFALKRGLPDYCQLHTAIGLSSDDINRQKNLKDPYILVDKNNSFISVFKINGTFQTLSNKQFSALIDNLTSTMQGYLQNDGHSITVSLEKDPTRTAEAFENLSAPMFNTAKRIGIKVDDIISSRIDRNIPYTSWEEGLLVLYTHINVLPKAERKHCASEKIAMAKEAELPRIEYGQNPYTLLEEIKSEHDGFISMVKQNMAECGIEGQRGILLTPLSAHDAVKSIRRIVNPEQTGQDYRPVLPGDKFMPAGEHDERDISNLMPQSLNYQICSTDVKAYDNLVQTGEIYHGFLNMEMGPQDIKPFSTIFNSIPREIPWRVRFDLNPKGLSKLGFKKTLAKMTSTVGDNGSIDKSLDSLVDLSRNDVTICSMKTTFSTWSKNKDQTKRNVNSMAISIKSCGNPDVVSVHGDPVAAWASTIPGFTLKNPSTMLTPPLDDALYMMPFARPANPWEGGSMLMRTPDGKLFPMQLGSSLQDAHIEAVSSPMGGGKSVLLNVMNLSEILSPGRTRLPLMTIIDVGPSSEGLVRLIRDSLPEDRKNEAVYLKLQNNSNFRVNPFDTQLGARYPTSREEDFLVDLLTLFCSDPNTKKAPPECGQLARKILKIVYSEKQDLSTSQKYSQMICSEIEAVLAAHPPKIEREDGEDLECLSWFEITDHLFSLGEIRLAIKAQRYAVPTIDDIIGALQNESIREIYGTAVVNQEKLLDFVNRQWLSATLDYSVFCGRTTFELSTESRIVAIDLQQVVESKTEGAMLKTSAMYMFSRQLAAKNYYLSEDTVLPVTPPLYHEYHLDRINDVKQERKIIAYDEFHNTGGLEAMINTIIKDSREGRKWNIRIILVSQYLKDFPEILLDSLSSLFVMKYSDADAKVLREKMNISEAIIQEMKQRCTGPLDDGSGSNFLAYIKTRLGDIVHVLTNTIGAYEAWAFTTKADDMALRNYLYERLGTEEARHILVKEYPTGSALAHINQLKESSSEDDDKHVIFNLAEHLINNHEPSVHREQLLCA